jgi:hypothetical protein
MSSFWIRVINSQDAFVKEEFKSVCLLFGFLAPVFEERSVVSQTCVPDLCTLWQCG